MMHRMTIDEQVGYLTKGCIDVVRVNELRAKLERAQKTGKPLTVRLMPDSNLRRFPEVPMGMGGPGAGPAGIFRHIALPNVRPALATLALVQFIWSWSNYFWPLVVMQDPDKQVAQVAMAALQTSANYQPRYGEMFAAATVITVPLILLAIVLQRAYVRGMAGPGIR